MSYDYILRNYGIDVPVGQFVQHEVTRRFGIIRPIGPEKHHYVRVQFEGDKFLSYCHPRELDYDCSANQEGVA